MSIDGKPPYPNGAMDMKEFVLGSQNEATRLAVPGPTSMDQIAVSKPEPEKK